MTFLCDSAYRLGRAGARPDFPYPGGLGSFITPVAGITGHSTCAFRPQQLSKKLETVAPVDMTTFPNLIRAFGKKGHAAEGLIHNVPHKQRNIRGNLLLNRIKICNISRLPVKYVTVLPDGVIIPYSRKIRFVFAEYEEGPFDYGDD